MSKKVEIVREEHTRYRDSAEQDMPGGTIIPRAMRVHEGSGARFPTHPIAHNLIEVDEHGRETIHTISASGMQRLIEANKDGEQHREKVLGYEDVIDGGAYPQKSANDEYTLNRSDIGQEVTKFVSPNTEPAAVRPPSRSSTDGDASAPSTEEAVPQRALDAAKERINPPVPEYIEEGPAVSPRPPAPPVSVPEVVEPPQQTSAPAPPRPAPPPFAAPQERRPVVEDGKIAPNQEIQEAPKDLDLEPDPGIGPKRLTSYAVPLRTSPDEKPPEPLIKPAMMPTAMKETPPPPELGGEQPTGEMGLTDRTSVPVGTIGAVANLASEPMQQARVRVRFIGPFGNLAVPYNVVFRYDIFLVMIQCNSDGTFYEPPGHLEEHVEVQWHGRIFMCLPGPYFIMPDQQTAITVFMIDEDETIEAQNARKAR